jgi:hypothetical protein
VTGWRKRQVLKMDDIVDILNDPEKVYPGNFDTAERANALLFGLCQEAADEIRKLRANVQTLDAMFMLASRQRDELMDQQRAQIADMRGRMQ